MKRFAYILLFLSFTPASSPVLGAADGPCASEASNAAMYECYAREQAKVNAKADSMAYEVATKFRKQAQQSAAEGSAESEPLRKAAEAVLESQRAWRKYRDLRCEAVRYSYGSGSGSGTAYEGCLFAVGETRLKELRSDFN